MFQSSFWFIKTLFYKFGFRNSGLFNISNFSVFIRDIKLDLFYSFLAVPHHGSYLKIQAQVCPICQNFNQSKNNQVMILWPLFGSLDRESWVV